MENIFFKISFPAEFHAQTAVEAALHLHDAVKRRIDRITRIAIETQESAMRIINKTGPLNNPADRDHCLQYMVAIALLFGELSAEHYQDEAARDPRIDALREKMQVSENKRYSIDYLDPDKRSIANSVQVFFEDGSSTARSEVEFPIGHRRRRSEGIPLLRNKFAENLSTRLPPNRCETILQLCNDQEKLEKIPVNEFMDMFSA